MMRNPSRIFVTGAGRLLGSELSGAFGRTGSRRRCNASPRYGNPPQRRPAAICPAVGLHLAASGRGRSPSGDMGQPGLGLDGASLAEIVRGLDLVIHGAAATGFNLSERVYRRSDPATRSNYSAIRKVERAC
jgi:nucleoside-diphosphate-sugar epimerase